MVPDAGCGSRARRLRPESGRIPAPPCLQMRASWRGRSPPACRHGLFEALAVMVLTPYWARRRRPRGALRRMATVFERSGGAAITTIFMVRLRLEVEARSPLGKCAQLARCRSSTSVLRSADWSSTARSLRVHGLAPTIQAALKVWILYRKFHGSSLCIGDCSGLPLIVLGARRR